MQETSDNGLILVGFTNSYGAGEADAWLVRTDSNGNKIWDRTIGGQENEIGTFIQQTSDGYITVGTTNSFSTGCSDIWLVKTDQNGNKLWDKTFGGLNCDYGYCVRQTSDGGFILVGNLAYSPSAYADIWLIKTDGNGNKLWDKRFGAGTGYYVQQISDGSFIIVACSPDIGVVMIKTDSSGNKLWGKTLGGARTEGGNFVQQTSDGGFIITGNIPVAAQGNQYDVLLLKTDADGNKLWDKTFGGESEDRGQSVEQTSDGGYVIGGITNSYGAGEYDVWVIKTDANGNKIWDRTFGGAQADEGYSVLENTSGSYVIAGSTLSYGAGYYDILLLEIAN
jgi:hypothetical protein